MPEGWAEDEERWEEPEDDRPQWFDPEDIDEDADYEES